MKKFSEKWMDVFAKAFYTEDYFRMSKMLGKPVKSQYRAEIELDRQKSAHFKKLKEVK